jgi:predicted DNA-binding transcriptional regulator YafY
VVQGAIQGATSNKGAITIKLRLYNTPDLQTWLLGHSEEIQIESPKELRDAVRDRALLALQALQGSSGKK